MLDEKVKGHEITTAPEAPRKAGGTVVDLMEALKRSLNKEAAPARPNQCGREEAEGEEGGMSDISLSYL